MIARIIVVLFLLLPVVVAGCQKQEQEAAAPFSTEVQLQDCTGTLTIETVQSMKELPVQFSTRDCSPPVSGVVLEADMPGMKMGMAPVTLSQRENQTWGGLLTFTMPGAWYVEVHASQGTHTTVKRYDLSVP